MSRTTCPADHDDRTPVTVMLSPAQLMRVELYLAQVRETHPGADDNAITDLIFARGLDAVMEKPMQQETTPSCEKTAPFSVDLKVPVVMPSDLDPETRRLVQGFAQALALKLRDARHKHGYDTHWMRTGPDDLNTALVQHVAKGDPCDVAAYCAFLWFHGHPTTLAGFMSTADHEAALYRAGSEGRYHAAERGKERAWYDQTLQKIKEQHAADIQRLTTQLEAARCRSIPDACAVLQDAVSGAGCCIHIDDSASVEVMFSDDDSIHVQPETLPDVLSALSVIEQHRGAAPATLDTEA